MCRVSAALNLLIFQFVILSMQHLTLVSSVLLSTISFVYGQDLSVSACGLTSVATVPGKTLLPT